MPNIPRVMKRIGIDASNMLILEKTGIEYYTTALILALVENLADQSDLELFLYFHAGNQYADPKLLVRYAPCLQGVHRRVYRPRRGFRLALPLLATLDHLDLLHLPSPYALRFSPCPLVVTVHDVAWAYLSVEELLHEGVASRLVNKGTIQQTAAIIAVSESTRRDAIRRYGLSPELVHVVYHGIDHRYQQVVEAPAVVRQKYGLEHYILNVAELQYRKNQVRLMQAFALLRERYRVDCSLAIVGREGSGYESVYAEWKRLSMEDAIRFLGYVPDNDLAALYSAADLVVYPSLYEGFGLPVLEAMACGAIVATSNTSALPEVGGDAAVYFDPYDVNQIAATMYQALTDAPLRNKLRTKGLERARRFTWESAARETLHVYQRTCADS